MKLKATAVALLLITSVMANEIGFVPKEAPTSELTAKADDVIASARVSNVSAAKEVDRVFEAADRLKAENKNQQAKFYYEKGLQLSPWDMDAQLSYSKTLAELGDYERAEKTAQIVFQTTERQSLLEEVHKLTGIELPNALDVLPKDQLENVVFCLVPIGPVQNWILSKAGGRLSSELNTETYIYHETLTLPSPHRSNFSRWMETLKKDIIWDNPWVIEQMKDIEIESAKDADSDQLMELLARIIEAQGGEDPRVKISQTIADVKSKDEQWDSSILLRMLMEQVEAKPNVVFIGITEKDLYSNDNNFLFGTSQNGSNFALFSYCRYMSSFQQEKENQKRLMDRIHKQILSSSGFALGIPRPTDPRSARSYPSSLDDHDQKETWLAPECIEGFEKALGHSLPQRTKEASQNAQN